MKKLPSSMSTSSSTCTRYYDMIQTSSRCYGSRCLIWMLTCCAVLVFVYIGGYYNDMRNMMVGGGGVGFGFGGGGIHSERQRRWGTGGLIFRVKKNGTSTQRVIFKNRKNRANGGMTIRAATMNRSIASSTIDGPNQEEQQQLSEQQSQINASSSTLIMKKKAPIITSTTPMNQIYGARDSPIVVERYKLVFVPIPKVACTAWKLLLLKLMGLPPKKEDGKAWVSLHNPYTNQLTYLNQYNDTYSKHIMTDPSWTRAIFLRNPHERLLSAYLDKPRQIQDCCWRIYSVNHTRFQDDQNNMELRAKCGVNIQKSKSEEFFQFFVNELLPTGECWNRHWDLQSKRLYPEHWRYINFVGHMEHLAQDAEKLLRKIGAWEEHGQTGWGPDGNQPVFVVNDDDPSHHDDSKSSEIADTESQQKQQQEDSDNNNDGEYTYDENMDAQHHATGAATKMQKYYKYAQIYNRVTELFEDDYSHPTFNFQIQQPDWFE